VGGIFPFKNDFGRVPQRGHKGQGLCGGQVTPSMSLRIAQAEGWMSIFFKDALINGFWAFLSVPPSMFGGLDQLGGGLGRMCFHVLGGGRVRLQYSEVLYPPFIF